MRKLGSIMTFALDPRTRTGIQKIDGCHESMLKQLEQLVRAVRRGTAEKHINEFLGFIEMQAIEHFEDEESFMLRSGYPGFLGHKLQHEAFRARLRPLIEEYRESGYTASFVARFGNLFAEWMGDHMVRFDLPMARWLREQNSVRLTA